VPPNNSTAVGTATLLLSPDETSARVTLNFSGLAGTETLAHIHGPGAAGVIAPVLFPLPQGNFTDFLVTLSASDVQNLKDGLLYIDVHSTAATTGEIRGQFGTSSGASSVQFNSAVTAANENGSDLVVQVTRIGSTSNSASVDYATSDSAGASPCNTIGNNASSRCDYLSTIGTLSFGPGETSKTIVIPIVDDAFVENAESFTFSLSNPIGTSLGSPASTTLTINDNDLSAGPNPIDTTNFFVRQHYLDFLNREPDAPGFAFWTNEIMVCGNNPQCIELKRINVSAAFFLSIEFQETGYFVYRTHKSGFGNLPGAPVPLKFLDFLKDTQQIGKGVQVGVGNWQAQLEANKQAYALAFVQRADFLTAFPNSMTAQQFVDKLNTNAGLVLSTGEKASLVALLGATPSDVNKRAQVLRSVVDDQDFRNAEFNRAFVLMQYFGYLRRNPNDLPDADFSGYNFWLNKLISFGGNYIDAEMVKAFIQATEYRQRFGP